MHQFFIKTPWLVKRLFPDYVWSVPVKDRSVYLTFDDGPHPEITPWVLEQLRAYGGRASFFCIGQNVAQYPLVYRQVQEAGHTIGNHTYQHPNGWYTNTETYLQDVRRADQLIRSPFFRPPYGRIRREQAVRLPQYVTGEKVKVIMWDVLSADFDPAFSPQRCLDNVLRNVRPGSVVVFHDSQKAYRNLGYILPVILRELSNKGFIFKELGSELL